MRDDSGVQKSGLVGPRGTIVLPAATRRRYGLDDGSLFIAEERQDGILIRPATVAAKDLEGVRQKLGLGIRELKQGKGIPGKEVEAELSRASAAFRRER